MSEFWKNLWVRFVNLIKKIIKFEEYEESCENEDADVK